MNQTTSGEARAAHTRTVGYKLERREVLKDEGRREDTRKQREERAIAGGQKIEWIAVLGHDCSATLQEVIAFLNDYAGDIGIEDDDVEIDVNKRPKVAPPSVQKMSGSLKDHDNEAAIRARGFGNALGDNKPTKEEADLRRALEAMDLYYYGHERALEKLSPAEREEHDRRRKAVKDRLDELVRQRKAFDKPTPIDPLLVEKRRQDAVFRLAERRMLRTNQLSRLDIAADGTRPGLDRDHDWTERNVRPDPDAPDFQAPTPSAGFVIKTREQADQRDHGAVNGGDAIDRLKAEARKRRLDEAGPKAGALLDAKDYAAAAALLEKVKADAGHGGFGPWLERAGIDVQVAQRCMRRANTSPPKESS